MELTALVDRVVRTRQQLLQVAHLLIHHFQQLHSTLLASQLQLEFLPLPKLLGAGHLRCCHALVRPR